MVEGIFVDGLVFGVMVLGILITFRIMNMADLTCDGSVATGAAVCATCIVKGMPIPVAMLLSFLIGGLCGVCTAEIHNKLHIPALLASILTMTMLYSVNLRILGNKANLPLLRVTTFYTLAHEKWFPFLPEEYASLLATLIIVAVVCILMDLFFRCDLGIAIGALGSNEQMVICQGMNPAILKIIGIGLSNGLIGLSGALLAQYQGFADANLGTGMVVQGLAGIMLGEFLFSTNRIELITIRALCGGIMYKALMFFGRRYGYLIHITPNDFKLLTGILVIVSLYVAEVRGKASDSGARKKALARQKEVEEKENA